MPWTDLSETKVKMSKPENPIWLDEIHSNTNIIPYQVPVMVSGVYLWGHLQLYSHVGQQVRFCRINRRGKPYDHSCQKKSAISWHLGVLAPSVQLGNDVFQMPGVGLESSIEKISVKKCSSFCDGLMYFFKRECAGIEVL